MIDENECVVYIASWDGYSDLWNPFLKMFWQNWPDCPFKVYLGSNQKECEHPQVHVVSARNHNNWTDRTREHLESIDAKYVLMMLDDWYLTKKVDSEHVVGLLNYLKVYEGHMLRLVNDPKPDFALAGCPSMGLLAVGKLNRTNTHATIWKKETLLDLMRDGESLWQFEVNGSIRSSKYSGGMFSVWNTSLHYLGAVDAGKWTRRAVRFLRSNDVDLSHGNRDVKTIRETVVHFVVNFFANIARQISSLKFRQALLVFVKGKNAYANRR